MIPAYQRNELEYDNRIKSKLNSLLAAKYTNQELVTFESDDGEAEELFISIEKMLFLIYSLLQESHSYLFSMGLGSMSANTNTTAPMPSLASPARGRPAIHATNTHIATALASNTHATATALGGMNSFRTQMGQIIKMGNTLKNTIKKITPKFNYLTEEQVNTLENVSEKIIDMWDKTMTFAENELANAVQIGASTKDIDIVLGQANLVANEVINPSTQSLLQLVASFNPISAPVQQSTVNTNASGDGYTMDNGHFIGKFI